MRIKDARKKLNSLKINLHLKKQSPGSCRMLPPRREKNVGKPIITLPHLEYDDIIC